MLQPQHFNWTRGSVDSCICLFVLLLCCTSVHVALFARSLFEETLMSQLEKVTHCGAHLSVPRQCFVSRGLQLTECEDSWGNSVLTVYLYSITLQTCEAPSEQK